MIFKSKNRFVFRAVIAIDALDVGPQRDSPDEQQKQRNADQAIDQRESEIIVQSVPVRLQTRGGRQGNELIHEDEKADREEHAADHGP